MKRLLKVVCFFVGLVFFGCGAFSDEAVEDGFFTVAEWNVQALFDGTEDGGEYAEYLESSGWTAEKYRARITAISQAIGKMSAQTQPAGKNAVPDLIGLLEIENQAVLDDLAAGLQDHGHFWTAFASLPGSSLGIGVISRFPFKEIKAHSITTGKETAPRPVLEVRVEPRGKPLVFLLCHWKSKLGNDTEAVRRASARVVQRRLGELEREGTPVIIMGDLNENHDEFYLEPAFCALLPDDPDAAAMVKTAGSSASGGFLVLSAEKPPRSESFDEVPLYTPWGAELKDGSYFYRDKWETIDHFLLSASLFESSGWNYNDCHVLNLEPFTTAKGKPSAYVPGKGFGLSDHLPLLLSLEFSYDEKNGEKALVSNKTAD